jgi:hypothetical protein
LLVEKQGYVSKHACVPEFVSQKLAVKAEMVCSLLHLIADLLASSAQQACPL